MGKLLVIDGLDGTGKTTQSQRIFDWLKSRHSQVRLISFPDYSHNSSALIKMYLAGEFGEHPEDVNAYAASSFYAVDRYASFKQFWQEDYNQGCIILAARYTTSNMVHQMSKLPKAQWEEYLYWAEDYEYRRLGLPRPDQVLLLDMPAELSAKMVAHRCKEQGGGMDIHEADLAYMRHCRDAALFGAARQGWQVVRCCDVLEQKLLDMEEITNRMTALLEQAGY